ncbi:MAG TPA: DUF4157 domain-containing protein [Pyrinomonadaceae bacterium]|jgi:hypothetical protein
MKAFAITSDADRARRHRAAAQPAPALTIAPVAHASDDGTLLQRKGPCACGGGCARCADEGSQQAKIKVSTPGDRHEQEADRIAEQVLRMPDAATTPNPARPAQLSAPALPTQLAALSGGGAPLPAHVRAFFEPRFGRDFSTVRVHTGAAAAESARAFQARAYTFDRHIVFGRGQYAPDSTAGRRLLAHELTHVVQQGTSRSQQPFVQREPETGGSFQPVAGDEKQKCLDKFDKSMDEMEARVKDATGAGVDEIKEAAKTLRQMKKDGKVVCGNQVGGGKNRAIYDNATGQLRLLVNMGDVAGSSSNLVHEGIHAVQAAKHPKTAQTYAKHKGEEPSKDATGALLIKWKAWTEYWAYRRAMEYDNLDPNRKPEYKRKPDEETRKLEEVKKAINNARAISGDSSFDPETWEPPK